MVDFMYRSWCNDPEKKKRLHRNDDTKKKALF